MADLDQICTQFRPEIESVFTPIPRALPEIISGDVFVPEQAFIRDHIMFIERGRLIFMPGREHKEYFEEYFVICRKLTIVGGGLFVNPDQFKGDFREQRIYTNVNVITWKDRLSPAPDGGVPNPIHAKDGASFVGWADVGQGNDGADGGNGDDGGTGADGRTSQPGHDGMRAPSFTIVALEVEFQKATAELFIDFDGQIGGHGGQGQDGGDGGRGMRGRVGESDNSWPVRAGTARRATVVAAVMAAMAPEEATAETAVCRQHHHHQHP